MHKPVSMLGIKTYSCAKAVGFLHMVFVQLILHVAKPLGFSSFTRNFSTSLCVKIAGSLSLLLSAFSPQSTLLLTKTTNLNKYIGVLI